MQASTNGAGPGKALVVDDDDMQLEVIESQLRQLGYSDIATAHNGQVALQLLSSQPGKFQLIVLDLHMPGMDGFELMEQLASAGFSGSLIIVTGQGEDVRQGAALVARLRRFHLLGSVAKPVELEALRVLLAALF